MINRGKLMCALVGGIAIVACTANTAPQPSDPASERASQVRSAVTAVAAGDCASLGGIPDSAVACCEYTDDDGRPAHDWSTNGSGTRRSDCSGGRGSPVNPSACEGLPLPRCDRDPPPPPPPPLPPPPPPCDCCVSNSGRTVSTGIGSEGCLLSGGSCQGTADNGFCAPPPVRCIPGSQCNANPPPPPPPVTGVGNNEGPECAAAINACDRETTEMNNLLCCTSDVVPDRGACQHLATIQQTQRLLCLTVFPVIGDGQNPRNSIRDCRVDYVCGRGSQLVTH